MEIHFDCQYHRRVEDVGDGSDGLPNECSDIAGGSSFQRDLIDELLVKHLGELRRYSSTLARNRDAAADLLQDTCVRILTRSSQFKRGTSFKSWAYSVMQSIWRNQLRYDGRRLATPIDHTHEPMDPRSLQAEQHMELSQVAEAVSRLEHSKQRVLQLVAFEGLTYREAALASQAPVGTVMSRLSRARADLAEFLSIE